MPYKIEYETYNNTEFKQVVFTTTKIEAKIIMDKLKQLKHVTKVKILPQVKK